MRYGPVDDDFDAFRAEMKGDEVVRMVPERDGKANRGHSCVKGRFAWGYATHKDRITKPMIRQRITDPWQEVSWEEAIGYAASEFKRIQAKHGKDAVGGITSSRCTNEETYLVQKLVRAAFGTNNVDTCARVCHSPTGYGLGQTFGTSAGTQTFKSIEHSDVLLVIGANPTDAHPVFAARMKRRLRGTATVPGAGLIIIDPRRIDLVRQPHIEAVLRAAVDLRRDISAGHGLADQPELPVRHQRRGRETKQHGFLVVGAGNALAAKIGMHRQPPHGGIPTVPAAQHASYQPSLCFGHEKEVAVAR